MISAWSSEFAAKLYVVNILKERTKIVNIQLSCAKQQNFLFHLERCFQNNVQRPHLFPGDFLLCAAFTDHWILGADLVMCLKKK